jgi:hypothetical protein
LNIEHPTAFMPVVRDLVQQASSVQDLLPQAALTVVAALPDLRTFEPEMGEILGEALLQSYSNRDLLLRLPKRRDLLEGAFGKLLKAPFGPTVETYLGVSPYCGLSPAGGRLSRALPAGLCRKMGTTE